MNLESMQRSAETIHVSAPSSLSRPPQTMPQRTPFAIQELLGLSETSRSNGAVSTATPAFYSPHHRPPQFNPADHHQMMAASRMFYNFNVAAAFHNSGHLGLQTSGECFFFVHKHLCCTVLLGSQITNLQSGFQLYESKQNA
jgi:hypothetical protein